MTTRRFKFETLPSELQKGMQAVSADHPSRFGSGSACIGLSFRRDNGIPKDGFVAQGNANGVRVRYGSVSSAFRALGRLLADETSGSKVRISETSALTMRGLMIDCSRNGVMKPEALEAYMRRVALMGVNMIMLYTEDTYEVPGEPYFGYLRGRYTQKELKSIDDYAFSLGIEMIPCIQALAHLEQILQWNPYFPLRDNSYILLAGEKKTYEFIRKLIRAASAPFRTRRIHLGMDEAHGLGTGEYQQKHGVRRPFDIMNEHLAAVRKICRQEGLQPMIWSDMYFRLGSKRHDYYDLKWKAPADAIRKIPSGVQLVYWDYYHAQPSFYRKMIAFHRKLGSDPIMGGGIWTWGIQWCALRWSFTAVKACLTACRQEGLKEVFMTMWGDDGAECDPFSALPGIQYFCELAFDSKANLDRAARRFRATCGCDFEPWVEASDINTVPLVRKPEMSWTNTAKSLVFQDPALAVMDAHIVRRMNLQPHYSRLARDLEREAGKQGISGRLGYPAAIARAIAVRVNLRTELSKAYRAGNRQRLRKLRDQDLAQARRALEQLWKYHRAMWMNTYKPFGWEVIEHRYGGLLARFDTLKDRLTAYLNGTLDEIPELAEKILNPWPKVKDTVVPIGHARVKTPSCIK
jgi:hypothetical protein